MADSATQLSPNAPLKDRVPNFMRSNMDPNGANRSGMGKFRADRDLLGPIGAKKAD